MEKPKKPKKIVHKKIKAKKASNKKKSSKKINIKQVKTTLYSLGVFSVVAGTFCLGFWFPGRQLTREINPVNEIVENNSEVEMTDDNKEAITNLQNDNSKLVDNTKARILIVKDSETKVPSQVVVNDLKIGFPNPELSYTIENVKQWSDTSVLVDVVVNSSIKDFKVQKFQVEVSGFASEQGKLTLDTQNLIEQTVQNPLATVNISQGSESKVPSQVGITDLVLNVPKDNLNYEIDSITNKGDDFVIAKVIISSVVENTIPKSYEVKVEGFASQAVYDVQKAIDSYSTAPAVVFQRQALQKTPNQITASDILSIKDKTNTPHLKIEVNWIQPQTHNPTGIWITFLITSDLSGVVGRNISWGFHGFKSA